VGEGEDVPTMQTNLELGQSASTRRQTPAIAIEPGGLDREMDRARHMEL